MNDELTMLVVALFFCLAIMMTVIYFFIDAKISKVIKLLEDASKPKREGKPLKMNVSYADGTNYEVNK